MALTESGGVVTTMPVMPTSGMGGLGADFMWIIVLFLLLGGGGFGNNANNPNPWIMNGQNEINANTNAGFQNAVLNDSITSARDSLAGLSNQMCAGFNGVEIGANARQMNDMQTVFNLQNAMNQGFNGLQAQLAQCCCNNNLASVETRNVVQTEGAATRLAIQNQTQEILDKLCQQEIEQLRTANVSLQNQLNMANLAASQTAQTAQIISALTPKTTTA